MTRTINVTWQIFNWFKYEYYNLCLYAW